MFSRLVHLWDKSPPKESLWVFANTTTGALEFGIVIALICNSRDQRVL